MIRYFMPAYFENKRNNSNQINMNNFKIQKMNKSNAGFNTITIGKASLK